LGDSDTFHLLRAVALAREHLLLGHGGPFGAVVVRDGTVIGEGWNEVTSANDPSAHAEIMAIRRAAGAIGAFSLAGATIYASSEPCPMCLAAIYWARLDRLVFAATAAQATAIGFDDAMIYREIAKPAGERRLACTHLPLDEAEALFDEWLRKPDRIPY